MRGERSRYKRRKETAREKRSIQGESMKKTKPAAEKKPEKKIRIRWHIRRVSEDGLLKIPKKSDYGGPVNAFEYYGYDSVEEAAKDILAEDKKTEFGIDTDNLVAIPFFEIYTEQEADE
jgi:hypothetical protein